MTAGEVESEAESSNALDYEKEEQYDTRKELIENICYSDRYKDEKYEYRHVILPKQLYTKYVDKSMKLRLLSETEWRSIGIQQSPGWEHYEIHVPEPHIFLFRRRISSKEINR